MSAATMTLGGPLSIACPLKTCSAERYEACYTDAKRAMRAGNDPCSRAPHARRVKAAPPAEEVGAGDLVLVQLAPGKGSKHLLALLVEPGDTPLVRLWRGGPSAFATPRRVVRSALLRRAPEDDPRVPPARVYLEHIEPVRLRVFDTTAHGRIWIVEVDDKAVRWKVALGTEHGVMARSEWRRATLAGEIVSPSAPLALSLTARADQVASAAREPWAAPKGW